MSFNKIKKMFLILLTVCAVTKSYAAENSIHDARHELLMWAAANAHTEAEELLTIIKKVGQAQGVVLDLDFIAHLDDDDYNDGDLKTALMCAVSHKNKAMVRALLAARADPNIANQFNKTALMYAACCGDAGIVHALLDARADRTNYDLRGATALVFASNGSNVEVMEILLADHLPAANLVTQHADKALRSAASSGYTAAVKNVIGRSSKSTYPWSSTRW